MNHCRFPVRVLARGLISVALTTLLSVTIAAAQTPVAKPAGKSTLVGVHQRIDAQQPVNSGASVPAKGTLGSATSNTPTSNTPAPHRMRSTTNAQRTAAAARLAARRSTTARTPIGKAHANAIVGIPGAGATLTLDQMYFSGIYPNYANSPLPNVADTVNCSAPNYCGIRKFVDSLPLLNTPNNLNNQLPVAKPDTTTFPGSDYYEISLVQFSQRLHSDLPAGGTLIRGYVQTNAPVGSSSLIPSYLGPIIVAQENRPVRVKFTNNLPRAALAICSSRRPHSAGRWIGIGQRAVAVPSEPRHRSPPWRQHPLDQRRHATPVDDSRR